jgi:hypothetical protein
VREKVEFRRFIMSRSIASRKSISRREFLGLTGMTTAGAILAGCAPKTTPAATQTPKPKAAQGKTIDLTIQLHKTRPDYVVYVPKSTDGSTHDTGNEHFLVFDGPDGS